MSWEKSTLGEISDFIRNGASIKQMDGASGLPITRIETIAARAVNFDKCGYANIRDNEYEDRRMQPGDILISHINSEKHLGKCAIFDSDRKDLIHGMNLLCLRPNEKVFPKFVFYYLNSQLFLNLLPKITKKSVNQASFTVTHFKELPIPLPPLPVQKQIAAVLEKADTLRGQCQQMGQELNTLAQSVFLEMFGDPVTNPKSWDEYSIAELLIGKPQIGTTKPAHAGGIQKVVRVGELGERELNYQKCAPITLEGNEYERYHLIEGDYLLARAIGSISHLGKASVYINQETDYVYDSHVMRLRFDHKKILSQFFYQFMKTDGGRTLFLRSSAQTSVQFNINSKQISGIKIPVPPIDKQKEYISTLNEIIEMNNYSLAQREEALSNFNSLMQRAFKGELDLKDLA